MKRLSAQSHNTMACQREGTRFSMLGCVCVRACVFCLYDKPLVIAFPPNEAEFSCPLSVCLCARGRACMHVCVCPCVLGFVRPKPPKACEECFQPSTWKRWWNEMNNQAHEKESDTHPSWKEDKLFIVLASGFLFLLTLKPKSCLRYGMLASTM